MREDGVHRTSIVLDATLRLTVGVKAGLCGGPAGREGVWESSYGSVGLGTLPWG